MINVATNAFFQHLQHCTKEKNFFRLKTFRSSITYSFYLQKQAFWP